MRTYFIILFSAMSMYASAQKIQLSQKNPNEFMIYGGLGLLSLSPTSGFFNGYAMDFGVGYTYFVHQNWGVHVGIGSGLYHGKNANDLNILTSNLTDRNGYHLDLHTTSDYDEIHKTMLMTIPVMIQYQKKQRQPMSRNQTQGREGFYAMFGVKANVPFNGQYASKNTTLTNLAYYPELDNWAGTQRFAGLGDFEGQIIDEHIEHVPFFVLALEGGVKWRIGRNFFLYTGAYFDYGLNSITKNSRAPFRNYVAVDQLTAFPLIVYPEKVNIMSSGVKLRLAFFREPVRGYCPY